MVGSLLPGGSSPASTNVTIRRRICSNGGTALRTSTVISSGKALARADALIGGHRRRPPARDDHRGDAATHIDFAR